MSKAITLDDLFELSNRQIQNENVAPGRVVGELERLAQCYITSTLSAELGAVPKWQEGQDGHTDKTAAMMALGDVGIAGMAEHDITKIRSFMDNYETDAMAALNKHINAIQDSLCSIDIEHLVDPFSYVCAESAVQMNLASGWGSLDEAIAAASGLAGIGSLPLLDIATEIDRATTNLHRNCLDAIGGLSDHDKAFARMLEPRLERLRDANEKAIASLATATPMRNSKRKPKRASKKVTESKMQFVPKNHLARENTPASPGTGERRANAQPDRTLMLVSRYGDKAVNALIGARQVAYSDNADKTRHFAVSARELLKAIINKLASDADVNKWASERELPSELAQSSKAQTWNGGGKAPLEIKLYFVKRELLKAGLRALVVQDVAFVLKMLEELNKLHDLDWSLEQHPTVYLLESLHRAIDVLHM